MKYIWSLVLVFGLFGCSARTINDVEFADKASANEAAQINTQLGVQYLQQGDLIRAKDKLEKAMAQDKNSALAFTYAGLLYEEMGEEADAEKAYRQALRIRSRDPVSNNLYATYLCRKGNFELAEQHFMVAAENPLYRTREAAYTNAGVCSLRAKDYVKAQSYFMVALNLNPEYRESLLQMANLKYELQEDVKARLFLERYFTSGGMEPAALLLGSQIENRMGDYEKANEYAEHLNTQYPNSPQALALIEQQ